MTTGTVTSTCIGNRTRIAASIPADQPWPEPTWRRLVTKADAWVTVAGLLALVVLGVAAILGAAIAGNAPSAHLIYPIIISAIAPTMVGILAFINGRNTARKVDALQASTTAIEHQTNGGLAARVRDAVHTALDERVPRYVGGAVKQNTPGQIVLGDEFPTAPPGVERRESYGRRSTDRYRPPDEGQSP